MIESIFGGGMFTSYGIRTESSNSGEFDELSYQRGSIWPHDNWIIAKGLRSSRNSSRYLQIRDAIISAFEAKGAIPEFYGVSRKNELIPDWRMKIPPCSPQAWSTGAAISFIGSKPRKTPGQGKSR